MDDAQTRELRDDAPLSAWKHGDAVDAATDALIEPRGDQLFSSTVTINKPQSELFAYWRDFARLPGFMDNLERVEVIDEKRSHWVAKAPGGSTVEWDSEIVEEQPDTYIVWASEEGADVPNSGRIDFRDAQADRGTIMTATILYDPPAGVIGKVVAKLFQREPTIQARRDLRRFKQLMETGEIATSSRNQAQVHRKGNRMRALTWHGKDDVRVETVDDPEIVNPRDAIIKVTSTAICGSSAAGASGRRLRLRRPDEGRSAHRVRLEEQASGRRRACDACRGDGRTAPPHGRAWDRRKSQ